jgi:hypothetical protein
MLVQILSTVKTAWEHCKVLACGRLRLETMYFSTWPLSSAYKLSFQRTCAAVLSRVSHCLRLYTYTNDWLYVLVLAEFKVAAACCTAAASGTSMLYALKNDVIVYGTLLLGFMARCCSALWHAAARLQVSDDMFKSSTASSSRAAMHARAGNNRML